MSYYLDDQVQFCIVLNKWAHPVWHHQIEYLDNVIDIFELVWSWKKHYSFDKANIVYRNKGIEWVITLILIEIGLKDKCMECYSFSLSGRVYVQYIQPMCCISVLKENL